VVDQVTGREHAGQVGPAARRLGEDVPLVVQVDLAPEELAARVVADRHEDPGHVERGLLARGGVPQLDRGDLAVLADDLGDHGVPPDGDLRVGQCPLRHDLAGPELVAAVDDGHRLGEPGQEGGLLHRRVATADDHDRLAAEEEPVTGGAGRHAVAEQLLLTRYAQGAPGRAGGQDDGVRAVLRVADEDPLHRPLQGHLGDIVGDELGTEPFGLLAHVVHQFRAHDPVGEAGEVLHLGGGHQRPAGLCALDHQGPQVGPGGIHGRRVTGRAGADNDQVTDVAH
jgi:hypothetical protein